MLTGVRLSGAAPRLFSRSGGRVKPRISRSAGCAGRRGGSLMATFFFRAVAADGKMRSGSLTGDNEKIVARELRTQGLTPVYVGTAPKGASFEIKLPSFGKGRRRDVLFFTQELSTLLNAGVGVHRAVRQQQVALQILGEILIGLVVVIRAVARFAQQPLIALAPIVLVLAVVVVAGLRDPDLEEVRIAEHGIRRGVTAAGVSPDARPFNVDPGKPPRQLLHAAHLVGQRIVAHVAVIGVVEALRALRVSHAIDRHDDESQFGERLRLAARRLERPAAYAAALRSRINVVDDGILFPRVEVGRLE